VFPQLTGFSYFGVMNHLSLFELNSLVKNTLSKSMEPSYWVVAEVGEMRLNQKGHCYLELIEQNDDLIIAKAKATIWAYTFRNLSAWFESITHQSIQTGMKLLMNVQVQFHEVYGFSLNIRDIDPNYTLGEKQRAKQAIIKRLQDEGILDMNRELHLPLVPQKIAVISSPTAAGFEDFHHQLESNKYGYRIQTRLFKAIMQGPEALVSIPKAIRQVYEFHDEFDILAILRGGGSQVDLDCYDSYEICSLLAQFPLPVVTGIGHERDETLADVVAHSHLKTPTAAAEFIINGFVEFEEKLNEYKDLVSEVLESRLEFEEQQLADFAIKLSLLGKSVVQNNKTRLELYEEKIRKIPFNFLKNSFHAIESYEVRLRILDPINVLKRGYTITRIDNQLAKNITSISPGQIMITETEKLQIESIIKNLHNHGQKKS